MGIVRNKLFENPDHISTPKGNYNWQRDDAIPFGYYDGKLFVGEKGQYHGAMPGWTDVEKTLPEPKIGGYGKPRYYLENQGRLWLGPKIISFWKYPEKNEFKKVIDEIGERIGQPDMFNDPGWRVEIVTGLSDMGKEDKKDLKKDWDRYDEHYKQELIPLKDYVSSNQRSKEEMGKAHVASPIEKTKMKRPDKSQFFKVRDKKEKPLAWKQAMYAEGKKEIVKSRINESPDGIEADNLYDITGEVDLSFYGREAIPFGYYDGKMRVGKENETHGDIHKRYEDVPNTADRYKYKYGGRIWPMQKVISFWNYPSTKELKKVLKDIEEEKTRKYGDIPYLNFNDPNWSIEVVSKKLPVKREVRQDWDAAEEAKLIPFSEYTGSADQSAEAQAQAHVKSPMHKQKKPQDSAYFKVRDSKEKPLAWKQALVKSESMIVRSRINESPDEFYYEDERWEVFGSGARAFEVIIDTTTGEIVDVGINDGEGFHGDEENTKPGRDNRIYPGRLFPDPKVITFWTYPNQEEFIKIVDLLQKRSGEKIWNNGWVVEVYHEGDDDKPARAGTKSYGNNYNRNSNNKDFIPVEKYMGSINPPEEEKAKHLMSYKEKQELKKKGWGRGSGSDKYGKKRPLKMRQVMYAESYTPTLNEKLLIGEPISVQELRDLLHKKVINFEFIKIDGEVRPAKGTTMMKYVPKDQQPTGENPSSDKVAAFYDLSKGEWRSVSNRSDEIVLKRDPETGKPKVVVSDKEPKEEPTKPQYPKEKDVEKRPIIPKSEPIVKPSIKPEVTPPIPKPEEVEEPEEETPLDINDPSIEADEVQPEEIVAPEPEVPEIEEPEEPSQDYDEEKDVSASTVSKEDITFPPPEEDITFPEEEEEEEESEEL